MQKARPSSAGDNLVCPSSQPEVGKVRVLGVVEQTPEGPVVNYLERPLAATPEVLAMSAPFHPTEIFRLAAECQTQACPHFDGTSCGLARRIVQIMPAVTEQLPACGIRQECRWFRQEGSAACRRCPQIATVNHNASGTVQAVVNLPPAPILTVGVPAE
jgi:hypothetical protein